MGYFVDSYERNKVLVAFAVFGLCIAVIYTALSRFLKLCSVICCIGFFLFFFTGQKNVGTFLCDAHWWSVLFITPVLNTQMNKFTFQERFILWKATSIWEIKHPYYGRLLDVYKNFKNHLPNSYLKKADDQTSEAWERNGLQGNQLILASGWLYPQALIWIGKF